MHGTVSGHNLPIRGDELHIVLELLVGDKICM